MASLEQDDANGRGQKEREHLRLAHAVDPVHPVQPSDVKPVMSKPVIEPAAMRC